MELVRTTKRVLPTLTAPEFVPIYFSFGVMITYAVITPYLYAPHASDSRFLFVYALLSMIVLGGCRSGYDIGTSAFKIILRSIIGLCVVYIAASHVPVADDLVRTNSLAAFELNIGWIVAVVCGVVGFFRPSFGLVPIIYIIWQKQQLTSVFYLTVDWMDHFTVIETGITLILGYLVYALGRRLYGEQVFNYSYNNGDKKLVSIHAVDLLVLVAIALHFGNYFYAGVIKLGLGLQHPLFWILDNQTQYLMLAGLESAVLPISFNDTLTAVSYGIMSNVKVLTNFVTLSIQLLAVVAIIRIRWAILITIAYDILHVTIFVLTGIFFWKFIILNLAIVAGLTTMRFGPIPRRLKVLLCAIVVCSPAVFQILPSYAWLDGRTMNSVKIIAVTDDGLEFRVPSNYFLGTSVTFAQHRVVWPQRGPASTETWATTRNADVMRRSMSCEWGYSEGNLPLASWPILKEQMTSFIQRHHQQILFLADEQGFVEYDLFPHHIFSVPWEFTEFRALDKRRIVKYRYQNETICLNYENGQFKRDVMWSSEFDIPIAETGTMR